MPTNYTPIPAGSHANAATINAPLEELDDAIDDIDAAIGSALSGGALAANTVNTTQIVAGAVTGPKLANDAVGTLNIADDAVTANKIAANAVTASEIQNNAVTTVKIADANVTTAKIGDGQVTAPKLAAGVLAGVLTSPGLGPLASYVKREGPLTYPTSVVAASLGSTYSENPAVGGALLNIDDPDDKLAITAGLGFFAGSATTNLVSPRIYSRTFARHPGRAIIARVQGASWRIGWRQAADTGGTLRSGVAAVSGFFQVAIATGFASTTIAHDSSKAYDLIIAQANQGCTIYYRNATDNGDWAFLWAPQIYDSGATNASSPSVAQVTYGGAVTQIAIYDIPVLGGLWSKSFGPSYESWFRVPSALPYTSSLPTGDGFMLFDVDVATADTVELRFRRSADTAGGGNYLALQMLETANQVQLIKMVDGVQTIIAGPTAYNIVVPPPLHHVELRFAGSSIVALFMPGTLTTLTATETFNATATGFQIPNTVASKITRFGAFEVYGLPAVPLQSGLDGITIWPMGDSKTVGATQDDPAQGRTDQGYPWKLRELLEGYRRAGAYEITRYATGGFSVSDWQSGLAAQIATVVASLRTPDVITLNIGTNNRGDPGQPDEAARKADFQADYGAGLDAIHAAFPYCIVLVALPSGCAPGWTATSDLLSAPLSDTPGDALPATFSGADADDTLASWIQEVLYTRPWARVGLDERVFLNDPSFTYVHTDGVHNLHAGYMVVAEYWAAAILSLFPAPPGMRS